MAKNVSKRTKSILLIVLLLIMAASGAVAYAVTTSDQEKTTEKSPRTNSQPTKDPSTDPVVEPQFDKTAYSLTDPTSPWVIVNKQHPLSPSTYVPADLVMPNVSVRIAGAQEMKLRKEAAIAAEKLFTATSKEGLKLQITTAYRGYSYQKTLYDGYVASEGQAQADTQSARPGYSEHQTGWAFDVRPQNGNCYLEQCFGSTSEGAWLAKYAHDYGFILRYPEDKTAVTGYSYEPWHFRYVGDLAHEMHEQGIATLEEFFDVSGGATYN